MMPMSPQKRFLAICKYFFPFSDSSRLSCRIITLSDSWVALALPKIELIVRSSSARSYKAYIGIERSMQTKHYDEEIGDSEKPVKNICFELTFRGCMTRVTWQLRCVANVRNDEMISSCFQYLSMEPCALVPIMNCKLSIIT